MFKNPYKKDKDDEEEVKNFANENVMSKSNLRQPKSFNFGFPDDDEDDDFTSIRYISRR